MVMVDEYRFWGRSRLGRTCHLTTDGDEEELHEFARGIRLPRSWFQRGSTPHYDLSGTKRQAALEAGAVFVKAREQAKARLAVRRARREDRDG